MKLKEAVHNFLSYCKNVKNLSEHTVRAYAIDLNEFSSFTGHKKILANCDRECIRQYTQHLFDTKSLKATSVKRRIACLKSMFAWYETDEVIDQSPFRKMDIKIKQPQQLPKSLSIHEIKALLGVPILHLDIKSRQSYQEHSNKIASITEKSEFIQLNTLISLEILFSTGIRVSELSSIPLDKICTQQGIIQISGKGDRERIVFLPDQQLIALIDAYKQTRNNFTPKTDRLLINTRGAPLDTQVIRQLIKRVTKDANLNKHITPHMFRHSAATHLLNSGVDIRFVQKLLGHQSITTTQIYTHVSNESLKSVICNLHPISGF